MAEIFRVMEVALHAAGRQWHARACGRPTPQGMWEGWIELEDDEGLVLRTERETTQPNRVDLAYWASGLTPVYLEGAFERAARPAVLVLERTRGVPAFDGPREPAGETVVAAESAVLDPFSAYDRGGEKLLRRQLGALAHFHLANIARAHGLASPASNLAALSAPDLVELIVAAVRTRVAAREGRV